MSDMKAVRIHTYGGAEVLAFEDAPRPEPGAGEVLIRVRATSVNPFDCAVRAGYMAGYMQYTFPLVLGTDAAGVVEKTGGGVSEWKPGDEVYTRAGVSRDGANAEYVVAQAGDVAYKPKSLDFIQSAALPHVTLTAWQALFSLANLEKGQKVLIHGAGGGVGHVAVQLARIHGALVVGTASGDLDFIHQLGAQRVIDYNAVPFESVVGDMDVVLDTVGGETQARSWSVLKSGGILVSVIQAPSAEVAAEHGVRAAMVYSSPPIGPTLTEVARLVDSGELKPFVSKVLPLSEIRQAHQLIEGRHTHGKIVLQVA